MKRLLLAWFALCLPALAQTSGTIPSTGGGTGCVSIALGPRVSMVVLQVTGTWSGTLQPEIAIQGQAATNISVTPSSSTASQSTITANGVYSATTAGADTFLLCGNTVASGTAAVYLNLSNAGSAAAIGGGGGGAGAAFTNNSVYAVNYGVKANTKWVPDATFTNGANTISCTNSDCNFVAGTDNGKICFGTNLGADTSILGTINVLAQGTLTVTGAQTATCSGGNWGGTTGAANVFVWGSDDSTAMSNAWNAAVGSCAAMILPSGSMLVQQGEFNTASTNDVCVVDRGSGYGGYSVLGTGFAGSRIIPTPNFNPATCTGGHNSNACFGGAPGLFIQNFSIWGAGVASLAGGFANKIGLVMEGTGTVTTATNAYAYNIGLLSWGAQTHTFTGLEVEGGSGMTLIGVHVDGMGGTNCDFNTNNSQRFISLYNQFCSVSKYNSVVVDGTAGALYSYGGNYGYTGGDPSFPANAIQITGTISFYSYGDSGQYATNVIQGGSPINATINITGASTMYMYGDNWTNPEGNQFAVAVNTSGAVVYASNTIMNGSTPLSVAASALFFDQGGNSLSGGTVSNSGTIAGAASITGVALTAGKLALSANFGTGAAVSAPKGYNSPVSFTVTNGSASVGASPTITYTFPATYFVAPLWCTATQVGGTNPVGTFTAGAPSTTSVVFTYSLTPTINDTEFVQVTCASQA